MKISKVIMIIATVAISMSMLMASANVQVNNVQVDTESMAATTLVGTVVDTSDNGIAGAKVTVAEADTSTTTDEFGTFTIDNLEEGTHSVSVSAEGYSKAEKEVEITEEGASVEFVLEAKEN